MTAFIDLTGQTFGRLTVVSRAESSGKEARWNCRCLCGTPVVVFGGNLRRGATRSCGCFNAERRVEVNTVHGETTNHSPSPTFYSWAAMSQRCTNPNHVGHQDYAARGITVCDRWTVFANFLADMGHRLPGTTLERLDNNRGYEPENCVWADRKTQARNKRTTRLVTINGTQRPLVAVCEEYGLRRNAMLWRWQKAGGQLSAADFEQAKQRLRPAPEEPTQSR